MWNERITVLDWFNLKSIIVNNFSNGSWTTKLTSPNFNRMGTVYKASKICTLVHVKKLVPCCSIFTPCSRFYFLSQTKETLCEHGRGMCLIGTRQGSAYAEPYCPRTASNYDTSCPGCERTVRFGVLYSRHKVVGENIWGLGMFFKHYFSL